MGTTVSSRVALFIESEHANHRAMIREAEVKSRFDEMPGEPTLSSAMDSLEQMPDEVVDDITQETDSYEQTYNELAGLMAKYGPDAPLSQFEG